MLILAHALVLLLSQMANAGNENGNGGDAVVCRNTSQAITSVELLDFYEARVMRGIQIDLGSASLSVAEKVDLALSRIQNLGPLRYATYKSLAQKFSSESRLIPNITLVDVPDSKETFIPKECSIEQVAVQAKPRFPEDPYYTVSKDLWDRMDADSQAGLILHEIIYRTALAQPEPHQNSIQVRYFNSYISSRKMSELNVAGYFELLGRVHFLGEEKIQGVTVAYNYVPRFSENGIAQEVAGSALDFRGKSVRLGLGVPGPGFARFSPDGTLQSFSAGENFSLQLGGAEQEIGLGTVTLNGDGSISVAQFSRAFFSGDGFRYSRPDSKDSNFTERIEFYPSTEKPRLMSVSSLSTVDIQLKGKWYRVDYYNTKSLELSPLGFPTFSSGGMFTGRDPEDATLGGITFHLYQPEYCFVDHRYYVCGSHGLVGEEMADVLLQGKKVKIAGYYSSTLGFYESGALKEVEIESPVDLMLENGQMRSFKAGDFLVLSPAGLVHDFFQPGG